jgi:hypothetical protein
VAGKGRTYELAFRIGGYLSRSFGAATGEAAKKLTELQRKSAQLAARQAALQKFSAVGTSFRNVGTEAAGLALGIGAAAAAAGAGLFMLAKRTADAADAADEDAKKLGLQIEALQELRYAAQVSGASATELDAAIQKMNVTIGQAAAGGTQATAALAAVGLTAADLARLSPDEALARVADGLRRLPGPAERAAAAQAILGRGARQLGAMLADGSDGLQRMRANARATGAVLSGQTARQASDFTDRLLDLQLTLVGLRNTVGAALIHTFTDFFVKLAAWLRTNNGRVRELAERFAAWLSIAVPKILELLDKLRELAIRIGTATSRVAEFVGGWDNLVISIAAFKASRVVWAVAELGYSLATASKAAWGLNAAILANPATWFIGAALAEVGAIYLLVKYWDQWTGWLQRSAAWVKVLGSYLLLILPPLWIPLLIAAVIAKWDQLTASVSAFGATIARVFGRAKSGLLTLAAAVAGKLRPIFALVELVALAAGEVWVLLRDRVVSLVVGLVSRVGSLVMALLQPFLTVGSLIGAAVSAIVEWIVQLVSPLVSRIVGIVALLGSGILAVMASAWDGVKAGWTVFSGWFTDMWARWGDTVKAIVNEVLASVLNLMSTPLRVGVALLNALPGGDSPHLVELRNKINGALAQGAGGFAMTDTTGGVPQVDPKPLGAALAGGGKAPSQTTTHTQSLALTYSPQIAVSGGEAAGMQAGLKAAEESLLEKLSAALEQQKRLAYG